MSAVATICVICMYQAADRLLQLLQLRSCDKQQFYRVRCKTR